MANPKRSPESEPSRRSPNAKPVFFRLGLALRLLRLRADLRQVDLARRAGVTLGRIGSFEQESSRPPIHVLGTLLEAMGATLLDLAAALERVQESPHGIRGRRAERRGQGDLREDLQQRLERMRGRA